MSNLPALGASSGVPPPPPNSRRSSAPATYQKPWVANPSHEDQNKDVNVSATVQVFCRFRPTKTDIASKSEKSDLPSDAAFVLDVDSNSVQSRPSTMFPDGGGRTFHFDRVFPPSAQQSSVYESVEDVVKGVMMGFNGTIMMYGQTSSGKTHSMEGVMTEGELQGPLEKERMNGWVDGWMDGWMDETYSNTSSPRLLLSHLPIHPLANPPPAPSTTQTSLTRTEVSVRDRFRRYFRASLSPLPTWSSP